MAVVSIEVFGFGVIPSNAAVKSRSFTVQTLTEDVFLALGVINIVHIQL